MSKEIENLNILKDMLVGNGVNDTINDYVDKLIEPIKQRLESINNAKPSEALKCLEELRNCGNHFWVADKVEKDYTTIKLALIQKSKKEQAWDIVKEKDVDISYFRDCIRFGKGKSLEQYNAKYNVYNLTEEEFNLLKECLG